MQAIEAFSHVIITEECDYNALKLLDVYRKFLISIEVSNKEILDKLEELI